MLQTKRLSSKKYVLWKNFTYWDCIVLALILGLAIAFGFFTNKFKWSIQLAISAGFVISTAWILLNSKKHNCRLYMILFRIIKHHVGHKKYSSKTKSISTENLIPYADIIDNNIVINKSGDTAFSVIKIKGFNVFINTEADRQTEFNRLISILNTIEDKISIVKTSKSMDLEKNIQRIDKQLTTLDANQNEFKKFYLDLLKEDLSYLQNADNIDNYYLVVYGKNADDLKVKRERIYMYLSKTKFSPRHLNTKEIIELLNVIFKKAINQEDLDLFIKQLNWAKNKTIKLDKLLAPDSVEFYDKYLKVDKKYLSFQTFNEFASFNINEGWVQTLFNSPSTVIWNLNVLTNDLKEEITNKATTIVETNGEKSKSFFKRAKSMIEIEAIENLIFELNSTDNNLFKSNFFFINQANSLIDLHAIEQTNSVNGAEVKAIINPLWYNQKQGYNSACFTYTELIKDTIEITSKNVARGWGYISSELNDDIPFLLGFDNTTNAPLLLDIKKKDASRLYSNMIITGTPGAGKSTLIKKFLLNFLVFDEEVIILDPQREYYDLARLLNGNVIELGSGINTTINPLQLDLMFDENLSQSKQNHIMIAKNITKCKEFFKILLKLEDIDVRFLGDALTQLYTKWNFFDTTKDLTKLGNKDFPIIDDLIELLKNYQWNSQIEKEVYENSHKRLLILLISEFVSNQALKAMYNDYTNINFHSKLNIIDTYNISTTEKTAYSQAALYLILSFLNNRIANNYFKDPNGKNYIILVIDEAHKFIDPQNPLTLDFMYQTAKTIRKYRGVLIQGTQNFEDYNQDGITNKSKLILENTQYSITLHSNQLDIEAIKKLYENRTPLTEQELQFLTTAQVGQGLLSVDNETRFQLEVYYNELEKRILFRSGDLSHKTGE